MPASAAGRCSWYVHAPCAESPVRSTSRMRMALQFLPQPASGVKARAMEITVRPLREADLPAADRIFRLAFGTFLGLPEPARFGGDTDYVRSRWLADPTAAFAAELHGEVVGSNFASEWGSV